MFGAESMYQHRFSGNVIIDPLAKFLYIRADISLLPVALTAILCNLLGSDESNSFFIGPTLKGCNFCFPS
jgi:hypothetical protein